MSVSGIKINLELKFTPNEVREKTNKLIEECRKVYDQVGQLGDEQVNCDSVLKVLGDVENVFATGSIELDFPQHVSMDKALRDASTEADQKLREFDVEISMRQDIFDKLLLLEKKNVVTDSEYKRYLERLIKIGKRNGLHLPKNVQDEIKSLQTQMNELAIQFSKNINEDNTILEFTDEELFGLPNDFIEDLEKMETGKRKVTLKYPHYFPIMRKAKKPETRKRLENVANRLCMDENTPILEELVKLRQKKAELLGFPNHAAFITDFRMAKTADNVHNFLTRLAKRFAPLWEEERKYILEIKKNDCAELGLPYDDNLNMWDLPYYTNLVEELKFAVDQNKLKEYFPLPVVTKGLLELYQELLDLEFSEVKNVALWHSDIQMFSVTDAKSKALLGYFFLDLFPREGKYNHAAKFMLQSSCLKPDGTRELSAAAMVANFPKPTEEKPSLLDHNDVVTFFHEFGHVMHDICSLTILPHFHGSMQVERDFVEAPSQMLENWCWEPEPLHRMSGHYKNGNALPDDMLEALVHSRLANTAHFNLRQISLALFDYTIHTSPQADTRKVFADIYISLLGIAPSENTNFAAHFRHVVDGYDSQYYGYLWSEVYSMDMFYTRFKKEGVTNCATGKEYREKILKPGSTKDALDMLKDFIGREPNENAFLISKGLKP